jgi:hypothetical protein
MQGLMQAVDAGRRELAAIKISQFRKDNPEIKQGSPEEAAVATFVGQGYDLDTAKKLALFDKLEAENRAFKAKQASVSQKRQAAGQESSSGIPAGNGLPARRSGSEDRASEVIDKGGNWKEVASAFFGIRG